jgi:DNA replication protein DnaC
MQVHSERERFRKLKVAAKADFDQRMALQWGHWRREVATDIEKAWAAERYKIVSRWRRRQELRQDAMQLLGVRLFTSAWFRNYQMRTDSQRRAMALLRQYGGPAMPWCFVLTGHTGVGKSHLMAAQLKAWMRRGISCMWVTEDEIYRRWMDAPPFPKGRQESKQEIMQGLADARTLFIDDFGVSTAGRESWNQTIASVLCERERTNSPTLITTNLTADQIASLYGGRIASRLIAGVCVRMDGPDGRAAAIAA